MCCNYLWQSFHCAVLPVEQCSDCKTHYTREHCIHVHMYCEYTCKPQLHYLVACSIWSQESAWNWWCITLSVINQTKTLSWWNTHSFLLKLRKPQKSQILLSFHGTLYMYIIMQCNHDCLDPVYPDSLLSSNVRTLCRGHDSSYSVGVGMFAA